MEFEMSEEVGVAAAVNDMFAVAEGFDRTIKVVDGGCNLDVSPEDAGLIDVA